MSAENTPVSFMEHGSAGSRRYKKSDKHTSSQLHEKRCHLSYGEKKGCILMVIGADPEYITPLNEHHARG